MAKVKLWIRIVSVLAFGSCLLIAFALLWSPMLLLLWICGWNYGVAAFVVACIAYMVVVTKALQRGKGKLQERTDNIVQTLRRNRGAPPN